MRKKNIIFGILPILIILLLSSCDIFWKRYESKDKGFSIMLPRSWFIEEGILKDTFAVTAKELQKGPSDNFRENISVAVSNIPEIMSLNELYQLNKAEVMKILPGEKYDISESDIKVTGREGKRLSFVADIGGVALRSVSALFINKNRSYSVNCACAESKYSKYSAIFDKAIKSIRIK